MTVTLLTLTFAVADLFVGRWVWLDSRERKAPAPVMAPVLARTIPLGPLGLAAYHRARAGRTKPVVAVVLRSSA